MASVTNLKGNDGSGARHAFVVTGMHRSGTSAMTRTLSLLGATLPRRLMQPHSCNPSGFWESQNVADLNDEILQALDSGWDDVFAFRSREYLSNFDRFFLGRAIELLAKEFNGAEVIALKDPRISILTTFWDRALREAGYETHYVVMVRNPLEVADSLRARDEFPREKSLLLWASYMIAADRDTRQKNRLFVSYDQLMTDWRVVRQRIEVTAGLPFPRDTAAAAIDIDRHLDRKLRHHGLTAEDLFARADVADEVKTLYRIFRAACEGLDVDQKAVDQIHAELAKMDSFLGPLLADLNARVRTLTRNVTEASDARSQLADRTEWLTQELEAERAQLREQAEKATRIEDQRNRDLAELESLRQLLEQRQLEQQAAEARSQAENEALRAQLQRARAEHSAALAKAEKERRTAIADVENKLGAALAQTRSEKEAVEARLDDRFREMATLSSLLAERERLEQQAREDAQWLRETGVVLLHRSQTAKGRFLSLLPAALQLKRQKRMLKRRGLFDSEAYLAAHPDIADDDADPLIHYLMHGIAERRPRA